MVRAPDFEGCTFINVLLEQDNADDPVRAASVKHLANIRGLIQELAGEAGIEDVDAFSRQWHILMKGSIVAAGEGDRDAGRRARELGMLLLEAARRPRVGLNARLGVMQTPSFSAAIFVPSTRDCDLLRRRPRERSRASRGWASRRC